MPTIVLIEDNAPLRENTKILLELNGYEVSSFDSGPPALEKLNEGSPDLVLCDIILPGLTGYDILGKVRKMPSGGEVPFIFLSALAEKDQVRDGMNLGADDYVTKPFTSDGLLAAIRSRLERSEKRRAAAELEHQRFEARKLEYLPMKSGPRSVPSPAGLKSFARMKKCSVATSKRFWTSWRKPPAGSKGRP